VLNENEIIERIKDYAIIKLDKELNIISWNSGAKLIFGYNENQIINEKFENLLSKEDKGGFQRILELLKNIDEERIEIKIMDINKRFIETETLIKKMEIEEKDVGFFLIIKDISREKIWIENIKNQVSLNKRILENIKEGIILLNKDNRIKYINEMAKEIFGIDATYIGVNISQVLSLQYSEKILKEIELLFQEEKKKNFRFTNLWKMV